MFQLIFVAILISLDGFLSGFCFGLKKIKISWDKLIVMSSVPFIIGTIIMMFANSLTLMLNETIINKLTFSLFFLLFVTSLKETLNKKETGLISILNNPDSSDLDHNQVISFFEAILLGCALTLDNSIFCLHYALTKSSFAWAPLCFALVNLILVKLGNIVIHFPGIKLLKSFSSFIPSILFLIFALLRIPNLF